MKFWFCILQGLCTIHQDILTIFRVYGCRIVMTSQTLSRSFPTKSDLMKTPLLLKMSFHASFFNKGQLVWSSTSATGTNGLSYDEFLEVPNSTLRSARIARHDTPEIKMLAAYPNPARDILNISYILPQGCDKSNIIVYDVQGKQMHNFNGGQYNGIIALDGGKMPNGIYTIELIVDKLKIATTKLEIHH